MKAERMAFKPSAKRDTPVEENMRLFDLLLKGDKQVELYCLRAKASYDSVNGEQEGDEENSNCKVEIYRHDLRVIDEWLVFWLID